MADIDRDGLPEIVFGTYFGDEKVYATHGVSRIKVDASYGAIQAGDLLVASPTPGHAMLAVVPTPGAMVGKALERFETDTGRIKVLVMLR